MTLFDLNLKAGDCIQYQGNNWLVMSVGTDFVQCIDCKMGLKPFNLSEPTTDFRKLEVPQ